MIFYFQDCFLPISYSEVVKNPIETIKQIYSYFGWDLTPETIDLIRKHREANEQNKHGKAEQPKGEKYGVSDEDIKENLKEFFEFFSDWPEKLM